MERYKIIFNDKSIRRQAAATALIMIASIFIGLLITGRVAEDYKKVMLEHDYSVAGYLSQRGVDNNQIAAAFTAGKTVVEAEAGALLLSSSGYHENTQNNLLPEVADFQQKLLLTALAFSLLLSLAFSAVLFLGLLHREKELESASGSLQAFMDGDISIRLKDGGEGSLPRLFAAVNNMMTSLTVHIEKEKQSRQFLKDTIFDISHQLKTPLSALSMYNEIICGEKTGNEVVESFTEKSGRELARMENLIQSLLKLARLDVGAIELEKGARRLHDFLADCLEPFYIRAEQEGKKMIVQCDHLVTLCFDEMWFGEAIGNLMKNALDHTDAGGCVEVFCTDTAVLTEIVVRDNGAGIHPEDIHHIFKRFYRSRFSKDRQGIGIGLALSKAIIEKHGGTITVQSELGHGAEFHLIFPKLTNL